MIYLVATKEAVVASSALTLTTSTPDLRERLVRQMSTSAETLASEILSPPTAEFIVSLDTQIVNAALTCPAGDQGVRCTQAIASQVAARCSACTVVTSDMERGRLLQLVDSECGEAALQASTTTISAPTTPGGIGQLASALASLPTATGNPSLSISDTLGNFFTAVGVEAACMPEVLTRGSHRAQPLVEARTMPSLYH